MPDGASSAWLKVFQESKSIHSATVQEKAEDMRGKTDEIKRMNSSNFKKDKPIKLVWLYPNTVVATELVSSVNPTHIVDVQLDAEWVSDILDMAILGSTLHSCCSSGTH